MFIEMECDDANIGIVHDAAVGNGDHARSKAGQRCFHLTAHKLRCAGRLRTHLRSDLGSRRYAPRALNGKAPFYIRLSVVLDDAVTIDDNGNRIPWKGAAVDSDFAREVHAAMLVCEFLVEIGIFAYAARHFRTFGRVRRSGSSSSAASLGKDGGSQRDFSKSGDKQLEFHGAPPATANYLSAIDGSKTDFASVKCRFRREGPAIRPARAAWQSR